MISHINNREKVDRLVHVLKCNVMVELLKPTRSSFEKCAHVALNVEIAIYRANRVFLIFQFDNHNRIESKPMETGNINNSVPSKGQCEERNSD